MGFNSFSGVNIDFVVPHSDNEVELGEMILKRLLMKRLKFNKPCIIYLIGDSGEGKSSVALNIYQLLMKWQELDPIENLNHSMVYTPFEYAEKFKAILFKKEFKNLNNIILDEARNVIKAKNWQSVVNQAISDVNATFRQIKPMVITVVSQDFGDITLDVRKTVTFLGICERPESYPIRFNLRLYKLYKDTFDLSSIKLKKRRITGYVVREDGSKYRYSPQPFVFGKVSKELWEKYEKMSVEAKGEIALKKLEILRKQLALEYGEYNQQIDDIVKFYTDNPERLNSVIERKRNGQVKIKKELIKMHDFSREQTKEFEKKLIMTLTEKGLVETTKEE